MFYTILLLISGLTCLNKYRTHGSKDPAVWAVCRRAGRVTANTTCDNITFSIFSDDYLITSDKNVRSSKETCILIGRALTSDILMPSTNTLSESHYYCAEAGVKMKFLKFFSTYRMLHIIELFWALPATSKVSLRLIPIMIKLWTK